MRGFAIVDRCNARFQEIFTDYSRNGEGKIFVSHFGEFSMDLVNSLTLSIENTIKSGGDRKGVTKKMFSILIEGLQNIRIHGAYDYDETQVSFLVILQNKSYYKVTFGNLIENDRVQELTDYLDFLNNADQMLIKQRYMEILSSGTISEKGGAGLGFITMALKTKGQIGYNIEELTEDFSCLTIELVLNRD